MHGIDKRVLKPSMAPSLVHLSPDAPPRTVPDVRRKRARTEASGVILARRSTSGTRSLDVNGVITFPLEGAKGRDFVVRLRECTNRWFHENLQRMLVDTTTTMLKHAHILLAKTQWDALPLETRQAYADRIDLRTDKGMRLAFDGDYIKQMSWWRAMPGKDFFRSAILYVKMGNTGMSLGNMAGAWTTKGFGLWAHLVPDVGLPMVTAAMRIMATELGLTPGLPGHFPHPIYKPPGGAALEIHHDQMAPSVLLSNLREHVASTDPSTMGWVRRHGIQLLAHLQGGTGPRDGATFVVGPMTPAKLLVCLSAYSDGRVGGDYVAWNRQPVGKIVLDWEKHLGAFNLELAKKGHMGIGLLAGVPDDVFHGDHDGFVVGFPVAWPHGSFANDVEEDRGARKGSRITVTLPIALDRTTQVPDRRIPTRLRHMATLSTGGHTLDEYVDAEAWLANDVAFYATGLTHANPHKVVGLIRHSEAPGPPGPFAPISVKDAQVTAYLAMLEGFGPLTTPPIAPIVPTALIVPVAPIVPTAPTAPIVPVYKPLQWRSPPTVAVLDQDVRIVKVKQPSANMLVASIKDIENRDWSLKPSTGFPAWVLVASSKVRPTGSMMDDLRDRLTRGFPPTGHALALSNDVNPNNYTYGSILGMILIEGCYTGGPPQPSVWYNPPCVAWVVSQAWEFPTPIPLDADDGMQTQASLVIRPQYRRRIEEQMSLLDPGYE